MVRLLRTLPLLVVLAGLVFVTQPAMAQNANQAALDPPGQGILPSQAMAALAGPPGTRQPDAFGTGGQWLSIFATQWSPVYPGTLNPVDASNYPYLCVNPDDTTSEHIYSAQVNLPNGAEIDNVYVRVWDQDANANWRFWLAGLEAGSGSGQPYAWVYNAAETAGTPGYTLIQLFLNPPVVVHEWDDINHDGWFSLAATIVSLRSATTPASPSNMCFFGAAVHWYRTISPAPATASFVDVPVGSFGFQHVEALYASGITAGCDASHFCPNDPLTRVQMAVFLAKALGLHWSE